MLNWAPIRYAHNGDVSIAYTVMGDGSVDLLFMGGFVSHLEIGWSRRWRSGSGSGSDRSPG